MRVLTDAEKEILKNHAGFQQETKWSVLNKSLYWRGLDGTSLPGGVNAASLDRWRKSKSYAGLIQTNPAMAENPSIISQFLLLIKNIACVNDNGFDPSAVVAWLLDDGSQDHINNFDTLADGWFDLQIATMV